MSPLKTKRWVLMNPGPVNVTAGVRNALLGPDLCHREPEFYSLLKDTRRRLLGLFGAERTHTVAVFTGSGSAAVEAMLGSYEAGGKILVLSNGVYGERLEDILARNHKTFEVMRAPLGSFVCLGMLGKKLRTDRSIRAIALVHHETSCGMLNPLEKVLRLAVKYKKKVLVDAVSSLGAETIDLKSPAVALVAGSSGKCLHGHPGLSFVLVRKSERRALCRRPCSAYLDLGAALAAQETDQTPFTPAVPLFYSFDRALAELGRQTVAGRVRDYRAKALFLERGLRALGVRFVVEKKYRSHVLTALWLPRGVSYEKLHDGLKRKGFVIYAGQSNLKGRIFRVSNLGDMHLSDLKRFVSALKTLFPRPAARPRAVVLAAGVGRRFGRRTQVVPKCLMPLGRGETLLSRYLDSFRALGVRDVVIVVGHLKEKIIAAARRAGRGLRIRFVTNPDYRLGSIVSLNAAGKFLDADTLVMDADVYFETEALEKLLDSPLGSAFLLDPHSVSNGEEMILSADRTGSLKEISKTPNARLKPAGEATGIVKLSASDARALAACLKKLVVRGRVREEYERAYTELMKSRRIGSVTVSGFWSEIDFEKDLRKVLKER